jgi:uncharacterized membrane protein YeaQ/YmgE (transglycosylase-associated protein family)
MIEFAVWVFFGALAGWITTIISGQMSTTELIHNLTFGILGAAIGGMIGRTVINLASIDSVSLNGICLAILGAIITLSLFRSAEQSKR